MATYKVLMESGTNKLVERINSLYTRIYALEKLVADLEAKIPVLSELDIDTTITYDIEGIKVGDKYKDEVTITVQNAILPLVVTGPEMCSISVTDNVINIYSAGTYDGIVWVTDSAGNKIVDVPVFSNEEHSGGGSSN